MVPSLDEEQQNPKDIALAMFRFRARRGTGVYYTMLTTVVVLIAVLEGLSAPFYFLIVATGLLVMGILFLAGLAGMKRFTQMGLAIDLLEQKQNPHSLRHRLTRLLDGARTIVLTLLPLAAAVVYVITGSAILGSSVLIGYVASILAYYFLVFSRRNVDSVLPWRIEDWVVVIVPPTLLLLFFFDVINSTIYLVLLLLTFLLTGVKSSFEAPQELVQVLDDKDGFTSEALDRTGKKGDVSLYELVSEDALFSLPRVGIMLALLGVEEITFTDLMLVVGVSKSSLNYSVNALSDAGYVAVRKGFKAAGGPRTFIQITDKGKDAIRTHFETMRQLASKYL